ncbi:HTR-like protein [Haloferax denitrificans ATCC 35960]|uniref:histidine kinase n=2 Tax=Haloferax denitrificans TaxID=35745 RepID=M0JCX1_9EURY|nr:HTR-like protein [Haloferax denitrificans ATCC 35960]
MPHEVAIVDADGIIVAVNEEWQRFADQNDGEHPEYWVGENYFQITQQADDVLAAPDLAQRLEAIVAGDADQLQYEYSCHSPDEQRWFRLDARRFSHGRQPFLIIIHTNITEQKLAELRAKARAEQLETVIDVLRHDLRNPLNIIDGYVKMLAANIGEREEISIIRQAIVRINEISENLFAFSKSSALTEVSPVSVDYLARTAWQSMVTEEATLLLEDSHRIIGDRRLLLQLFENLFRNAIEHAGPTCTVRVGVLRDGFYVEDDGTGIPEAMQRKAIGAKYSTTGTIGLGLSVVQAIARGHDGELSIQESSTGGARFELTGFEMPPEPPPGSPD